MLFLLDFQKKKYFILLIPVITVLIYLGKNRKWLDIIYQEPKIHVRIDSGVLNPGFYDLMEGETMENLVKKAGGLSGNPVLKENEAKRVLFDGEIINIGDRNGGK